MALLAGDVVSAVRATMTQNDPSSRMRIRRHRRTLWYGAAAAMAMALALLGLGLLVRWAP